MFCDRQHRNQQHERCVAIPHPAGNKRVHGVEWRALYWMLAFEYVCFRARWQGVVPFITSFRPKALPSCKLSRVMSS